MSNPRGGPIPMSVHNSLAWIERALERGDRKLARLMFNELLDLLEQQANAPEIVEVVDYSRIPCP